MGDPDFLAAPLSDDRRRGLLAALADAHAGGMVEVLDSNPTFGVWLSRRGRWLDGADGLPLTFRERAPAAALAWNLNAARGDADAEGAVAAAIDPATGGRV
jgi:hypothetical protein